MISVILSYIDEALYRQVAANVEATIGVPYELLAMDNRGNGKSISQEYNDAVGMAKYPYACFIHVDVLFHTQGWGERLVRFMESTPGAGLVGIGGSTFKSLSPSSWNNGRHTDFMHLVQHYPRYGQTGLDSHRVAGCDDLYCKALIVDAVFMFTRTAICKEFPFDDQTFQGYHGYDLDYGLQISGKWQAYVTFDLVLEHFSPGVLRREWMTDALKLSRKWASKLPMGSVGAGKVAEIEWRNKVDFLFRMNMHGYSKWETMHVFFGFGYFRYFSLKRNLQLLGRLAGLLLKRKK